MPKSLCFLLALFIAALLFQPQPVQAGFEGKRIVFVDATSRTLLRQRQIDFAPEVEIDLEVEAEKGTIDSLFESDADFAVVLETALAKADRRVLDLKPKESVYVEKTERVVNPDWKLAKMNAFMSKFGDHGEGDRANLDLVGTPRYIDKPVHRHYVFEEAKVRGTRRLTVNYYIIDLKGKRYFKSTFDAKEEKQFKIAYRMSKKDVNNDKYLDIYDLEKDVKDWEKQTLTVPASEILRQWDNNPKKRKKLTSITALRKEMLRDKNTAIAEYEKSDFRETEDARMESVVAVYRTKGMGSGFFITPDIVLTNQHVVSSAEFVELKLHNGRETFGRVIGKDVRLDLALIKTQDRGKPVRFYKKRDLELGLTTEAFGHPQGFEFSITRGAISAVRHHWSISLPKKSGKKVLYIQTDTPINGGNSGGPLFLANEVIGVNTWGVGQLDSGLNFSVHYGEVLKFLEDVLPEYSRHRG